MARRRTVIRALRRLEAGVSRAYVQAIRDKRVVINELEAAIIDNDIQSIQLQLELDDRDLAAMMEHLRDAAIEGGMMEGPGRQGINPNSAAMSEWLQEKSSRLITVITEQQREIVREVLAVNGQLGKHPRSTALDLVGRMGSTGRREGGIIGLNEPQARAASNARLALESGDPELMRQYLTNVRRDRRYDGIVRRAIAGERPVAAADVDRIVSRYQDRLLVTRGETVARTETIEALSKGREQRMQDYAEEIDGVIYKRWEAGPDDGRQREAHSEADGQTVRIDEPFIVNGERLMFPGDTSLGASAGNTINCRCGVTYEVRPE